MNEHTPNVSRRDFVKTTAVGLGGLSASGLPLIGSEAAAQSGRPPSGEAMSHDKIIITLSPSGRAANQPANAQPASDSIKAHADAALQGINAGAAIVHLRGGNVNQGTRAPGQAMRNQPNLENWRQLTEAVRSRSNVIVNYGSAAMEPAVRKTLLTLKPDAGSVLVGHHYGGLAVPFENQKQSITDHAAAGVLPEIEIFHTGDAGNLLTLVETGLLRPPYCVTLFMNYNAYYRVPATVQQLDAMIAMLPPDTHWTVCVRGEKHLELAAYAIGRGGHVRTGLENSFELSPGHPPRTQAECVERIVQMARSLGREIATADDARHALGLPRKPEVLKS